MTRKELISAVAEHTKLTKSDVERVLYATFDLTITNKLAEGVTVSINDFGKFEPIVKGARKGRNPQTGEEIQIDEKAAVKFKPSSTLKEKLN